MNSCENLERQTFTKHCSVPTFFLILNYACLVTKILGILKIAHNCGKYLPISSLMEAPSRVPPRISFEISLPILEEILVEVFPDFVLCTHSDVFTVILLEATSDIFFSGSSYASSFRSFEDSSRRYSVKM